MTAEIVFNWPTIVPMAPLTIVFLPMAWRRAAWELWVRRTTGKWPE